MSSSRLVLLVALLATILLTAGITAAAPVHGDPMDFVQPDGTVVTAYAYGDEYGGRLESKDGYTLVADPQTGWLCYARLNHDGSELVSTGLRLAETAPAGIEPHRDVAPSLRAETATPWKGTVDLANLAEKWTPQPQSIHGLTILIDFSDYVGTIPPAELDDFMDLEGFTGFTDGRIANGSVKDYFYDVSGGMITYTNTTTTVYYRASQTYEYWRNASMGAMDDLVEEALVWLDQTIGYDFSVHDGDGDGVIEAINVLTAGYYLGFHALHPHFSQGINMTLDGVVASHFQNSYISPTGPPLAIVCHENGHMLFRWPDLYGSASSAGNLSGFCLMGMSNGGNPVQPNAYLKIQEGWVATWKLTPKLTNNFLRSDVNTASILTNTTGSTVETYVLENRQQVGRDVDMPDAGAAIYRIVESPTSTSIVLVEADGGYDLINGGGASATDLWSAPGYTHFDFSTTPAATWAGDEVNLMNVEDISANGTLMTFNYYVHDTAPVEVQAWPPAIAADWTISGPGSFSLDGSGYESLTLPGDFHYTVDYHEVPLWITPPNSPLSQYVAVGTTPTTFYGYYGAPMLPVNGSGLSDTGDAVGCVVIDFDADGDEDVFVINDGTPNQLLRNDNSFTYTDVAPPVLANAAVTGAAWADIDGDGDQDAFLFGDNGLNMLLEGVGGANPTFTDVSSQTPALATIGTVNSASWVDIDADGALDLFLTRADDDNLRFDGAAATPFALTAGDAGFATAGSSSFGARWGDLNGDGWVDLLVGATYNNCRLALNNAGTLVHPNVVGFPWTSFANVKDAEFGDIDHDGLTDVILLTDYNNVAYYLQDSTQHFVQYLATVGVGNNVTAIETGDFDNDGDLDVYYGTSTDTDFLAVNDGVIDYINMRVSFSTCPLAFDGLLGPTNSVATWDYNNDGGLDVFVARDGVANLAMLNWINPRGHWLEIDLTATTSHQEAKGAKVKVYAGGEVFERDLETGGDDGQSSGIVHFGLGDETVVTAVIVSWPGAAPSIMTNVAVDQKITITEVMARLAGDEAPTYITAFKSAYPNPFNPMTNIAFSLSRTGPVKATVYALDGSRVKELVNEQMSAGDHVLEWHGTDDSGRRVGSGTYFCRIHMDDASHTAKLMLIK